MKKILPIIGCVLLVIGIWLIFHANADIVTPNDVPVTPAEPIEPVKPKPKPGSEQGSTQPPASPVPADDKAVNPLKAPVADKPCTDDVCPCNKTEQPAGAAKKQYTPVPWATVPGLTESEPPQATPPAAESNTETITITRGPLRRLLRRN
ncbi:MAG: hypothetical protein WC919_00400 [Candidatus Paceibacterota bacterium]|jgi:hypothetical protein